MPSFVELHRESSSRAEPIPTSEVSLPVDRGTGRQVHHTGEHLLVIRRGSAAPVRARIEVATRAVRSNL